MELFAVFALFHHPVFAVTSHTASLAPIFAISAGIITSITTNVLRIQGGENSSTEVSNQLNYVLTTVQRLVQQSSEIQYTYEGTSTSTSCTTFCTLELRSPSSTLDPTWITSDINGVYLQQGGASQGVGTINPITNGQIKVNNLQFTVYTIPGGNSTVQINASFSYNTSNPQLAVTKTLESAIGRVSAATFDSAILPRRIRATVPLSSSSRASFALTKFVGQLTPRRSITCMKSGSISA